MLNYAPKYIMEVNKLMVTAKELINNFINCKDDYNTYEYDAQESLLVEPKVLRYLEKKLELLKVKVPGQNQPEPVLNLMHSKLLEGWCWQTTETVSIFLDNDAYIERGYLILYPCDYYWHSWICFNFEEETYVFDPCLQKVISKDLYYKIFKISEDDEVGIAKVTAKEVKRDFLERLSITQNTSSISTYISGNDDKFSPMYRNSTEYTVTLDNSNLTSITAKFIYNC